MAMADEKLLIEGFQHGMSWMANGTYTKMDDGNWEADVFDRTGKSVAGVKIYVKKATDDDEPMFRVQYEHKDDSNNDTQELLRTKLTLAEVNQKQMEHLDFGPFLQKENELIAGSLNFDYERQVHTVSVCDTERLQMRKLREVYRETPEYKSAKDADLNELVSAVKEKAGLIQQQASQNMLDDETSGDDDDEETKFDVLDFDSEMFTDDAMKLLYARTVTKGNSKLSRAVKTLDEKIKKHKDGVASSHLEVAKFVGRLDKQSAELTALFWKLAKEDLKKYGNTMVFIVETTTNIQSIVNSVRVVTKQIDNLKKKVSTETELELEVEKSREIALDTVESCLEQLTFYVTDYLMYERVSPSHE